MHEGLRTRSYRRGAIDEELCTRHYGRGAMLEGLCTRHYARGAMHEELCTRSYARGAMREGLWTRSYARGAMIKGYARGAMLEGLCMRGGAIATLLPFGPTRAMGTLETSAPCDEWELGEAIGVPKGVSLQSGGLTSPFGRVCEAIPRNFPSHPPWHHGGGGRNCELGSKNAGLDRLIPSLR